MNPDWLYTKQKLNGRNERTDMAEKIRKRMKSKQKYKWNLKDIYASDEAWQKDYDRVSGKIGRSRPTTGRWRRIRKKAIRAYFDLQKKILPDL